ncbi:hypothetical protein QV06_07630 [Gallibacterium genomosp. 3]|uniref:Bacterial Ig domain-containing protein n=1 Tax=Gallibacterium genomosp. 3 TaxID=505345 RepID=A0A1A7PR48_9PAST|nr:Ig-like domain-containing protein [Gallibacterium genomosp. 3]OBX04221.1 hypothetical protein QV06_07630 [Gallibacterium genomosp. 3]
MALILIAKKSGKKVNLSKVANNGKYTELAVPGEEYYLIDTVTGKTPEDVKVTRSGDDLIIRSEKEHMEVIIDEFWHECTPNDQCYALFDVPATETAEAGQVIVTQVGADVSAFEAGMVGSLPEGYTISPWLAGIGAAALLGGIATGSGGSSGGSHQSARDTTAPEIKSGSLEVSGDGKHVTGKTEPGATVTIKDGDTVIGTGTADQNGNFDVAINPPKTNGETLTVTVKDAAGNTSTPSLVQADDTTAPNAPTLNDDSQDQTLNATDDTNISGSAPDAKGGTVTLVDADGNPVTDADGNPITAPIDNDGNFDLDTTGVPDGNYGVQVKDEAGNPSTDNTPITIDRTVPVITSVAFADNNNPADNQLTRNEIGTDGKTLVNVNFDKATVKVDDIIKVNGVDHKITAADITAGQAQVEIPVGIEAGHQGILSITAQITDTAGNQSNTAADSIEVNRAVDSVPRVVYSDDANKDGTLSGAEIGSDNSVTAQIVLPKNLSDGDKVTISGQVYPINVNDNKVGDFPIKTNAEGNPYIEVPVDVPTNSIKITTPVVVTVAGKDTTLAPEIKVDTVAPQSAPELTVEGLTATDTMINAAEAKDGLNLTVTIPQGTQEGDHIIIKDGTKTLLDRPLTQTEVDNGTVVLNTPAPVNGTKVNLTATVAEPRTDGIAQTSTPVTATVDTSVPGGVDADGDGYGDKAPTINFTQDTQPEDGKLNAAELNGQKAAITIKVPTDGVAINDTLVYTVNDGTEKTVTITAAVKENGFTVPANELPATGTITVKAYVKDNSGNRSVEAEKEVKIDTQLGKPTLTAKEDGSVDISLPQDAEIGDTVKVEYTDEAGKPQTVTLTKSDSGWTSDKPELIANPTGNTATLPEDGIKENTPVTVTANDTAGNTASVDSFTAPDVTAPSEPELTANDDGSVKLDLPTNANPGDQVKVTVTPEGATEPTTVTLTKKDDGTWESDEPTIVPDTTEGNKDTTTIPEDQVKDGSPITAVATDGTNSSEPKTVDATDKRMPMLSLTGQSDNKILDKTEGNNITGKVTYNSTDANADSAESATVILKNAQGEQVAETTTADDGIFTFASVADGKYSIEVTSASGETGTPITDILVDHVAPTEQDIKLAHDTGTNTTDGISKDGTLEVPAGDNIKVTVGGKELTPNNNGKYVLEPGEYAAGSIKVTVKDAAGNETISTNARPITVDVTAPAQPTINPQANGSVSITLPSENVEAGDTVEVAYTDESGVKQTVTLTKDESGWTSNKPNLISNPDGDTATIPATSVKDGGEVTAVTKDSAGNEIAATPQNAGNNPDTTAPFAPVLTPKADGTMDVELPTDANPGDKVEITVTPDGETQSTTVTLTKKDNGTWESDKPEIINHPTSNKATIPENQVKDGSQVTAVATDEAGNSAAATPKNATDTRTPVISLTGESEGGVLDATEGGRITGKVIYNGTTDEAEGAIVKLVDEQGNPVVVDGQEVNVAVGANGTFTFDSVPDGKYSLVVTSASGKSGTPMSIIVDHSVPGDRNGDHVADSTEGEIPVVKFVDDKNPTDGVLTRNEVGSNGKVKVEVTLPTANVNKGDTVILTTNGSEEPVKHTITAAEAQSHKATIEVPVGTIGAETQENLTVSAKVVDAAGQSSQESNSTIPVDRTVNGTPSIEYIEDTGSTVNGTLVGKEDGILWASENAGDDNSNSTTVKVNLPQGIGGIENPNDAVNITINGTVYTLAADKESVTADNGTTIYAIHRPSATDSFDPYVEIPVTTTSISEIKAKVEVSYTKAGAAEVTNATTEEVTLTIDSAVPGGDTDNDNVGDAAPILTITEAANGVSADDLSDSKVEAQITLPVGVQVGDHIILKDASGNVLADVQVDADKQQGDIVTVDIPKAKLPDGDYSVTAIIKEDGEHGRESAVSDPVEFKVDSDAPSAPTPVATPNGGVDITLPADAQTGDQVEVKYTDENGNQQTVTLTKGNDGWASDNTEVIPDSSTDEVTLPANQVKDGTQVTATASDGVNPGASVKPVTVKDIRTPVVTLTDQSADGKLTKVDNETNTITGKIAYSDEDSAEGATVILVAENGTEKTATVQPDGTFKFENVDDGVYTIKAITTGGVGASNTTTVTVALNSPADASITLKNDNGTNANDKISNDGTLAIDPKGATIIDGSVEYSKDGTTWTDVPVVDDKYVLPEDGTYSVRVTTEDSVGNTTTTKVDGFVVDKTPPADAIIKLTSDTGESGTDNISKEGGLTITPAGDASIQTVEYQNAATGVWTPLTGPAYTLPAGTYAAGAIKVTTVDTAGNTKETLNTDSITVDTSIPTKADITLANDSGTAGDGISKDGTLVTPKVEGESIKSVTVNGQALSPNADGKYVLPDGTYTADAIKVTVVDKAGNETVSTNAAPITVDTTLPTAPIVEAATEDGDGSVAVGLPDDAKVGDKVEVTFTGENDQPVTITLTKGENSWTPSADLPDDVILTDNTVKIGENAVKDSTPVNAKSIDVAGNENLVGAATAGNDALSTTPSVTVVVAQDGYVNKADLANEGLIGTTTNAPDGSIIKLLDKNDHPVDIGTISVTNGRFTIPADKVPEGDYKITVTTPAADGGKVSAPTPLFTVDKTVAAPTVTAAIADNDGSVTVGLPVDAKVGDKVEVSVTPEDATEPVTVTLEKQADGTWQSDNTDIVPSTTADNKNTTTIPENAVKDGSTVTAKSVDAAGNEAAEQSATAGSDEPKPTITMGDEVSSGVNKAELSDGGISGTVNNAPAGAQVQLYKGTTPVGEPTTVGTGGAFTIPNTGNAITDGDDYTVKLVSDTSVASDPFKVDTTAPAGATITLVTDTGTPNDKISQNGELNITPADDANIVANSVKYSTDGENWTSVPVVNDKYVLPEGGTYQVQVQTQDEAGNVKTTTVNGFVVDKTAPQAAVTAKDDGFVEITLPAQPEDGDKVAVTYTPTDKPETTVTLSYDKKTGTWLGLPEGSALTFADGKVTIPADEVADNTTVKAVGSDLAGNTQAVTDGINSVTASAAPVVAVPSITMGDEVTNGVNAKELADGISGKVENAPENAQVQLYNGQGTAIGSPVNVKADGTFIIPKDGITDGENYTVKLVDNNNVASDAFAVDTVAPKGMVLIDKIVVSESGDRSGSVDITLPKAELKNGDKVEITYTPTGAEQPTTTTLTYQDGSWAGDLPTGSTNENGTITIPASSLKADTPVTAIAKDVAGNERAAIESLKVVFPSDDLSNNDAISGYDVVLNGPEAESVSSSSNYRVYLPEGTKAGDVLEIPVAGRNFPYPLKGDDSVIGGIHTDDNGNLYTEFPVTGLDFYKTVDGSKVLKEGPYEFTYTLKPGANNDSNLTAPIGSKTKIYIDATAPTVDVATTDTTATVTLPTESDAASVTVKVGDATVTLVKNDSTWTTQAGSTLTPTIENGKAVFSGLEEGTTITATAIDSVGNISEVSKTTQALPMSITTVSVTDEDNSIDDTQVVDNDVSFSYTLAGKLDQGKLIRIRVVDENGASAGETKYFTPTQGATTGSLALPSVNGKNLKVVADIVDAVYRDSAVAGSAKNADFTVDNINSSEVMFDSNNPNAVTVDGTPYNFGTAQNDKVKTASDGSKIYNPKLDWLMRPDDEDDGDYFREIAGTSHDQAPNWRDNGNRSYSWAGTNANDVIIAASVQTDEFVTERRWKGVMGAADDAVFNIDTAAGNDYIEATGGITGATNITTGVGDDTIKTVYLNGKQLLDSNFNGAQQISMGDGNDQFLVTGNAATVEYTATVGNWNDHNSALYNTNSKIDMGNGNDILKVTGGFILAANESNIGNYFSLGSGNDEMETKTISSEKHTDQGSNIINLGSGYDRLTVNGDIMGEQNGSYNASEIHDHEDWQARFLLMSKDSSDVHITGNVGGKVSMLMGNGDDNIRIDQELWMGNQSNVMDWLSITLNRANIAGWNNYYVNENSADLRDDINTALSSGVTNSGASGLGVTYVTKQLNPEWQADDNIENFAARIGLGNGDNYLAVGGSVTNANILSGTGKDVVKLGFHPDQSGDASFNWNAATDNTKVWTGAGNDLVMMVNVANNVRVYTGADSDDIQLYNVNGTNNRVEAGDGNDIIRLYGKVTGSKTNIFDGNNGYDTVIIGTAEDGGHNGFTISGVNKTIDDHSQLWHIEEIQFGSNLNSNGDNNSGDWIKINDNEPISDSGKLFIRDEDGKDLSANQVDIRETGWKANGQTFSDHGDGITYDVYTNTTNSTAGTLYIQHGIDVLI